MATETISIAEGDSLNYRIPVYSSGTTAYVWTTETAICTIRQNKTDAAALLSLTSAGGSIVLSTGYLTLYKLAPALAVGTYYYDIQITFADGQIKTIQDGIFSVTQDVT